MAIGREEEREEERKEDGRERERGEVTGVEGRLTKMMILEYVSTSRQDANCKTQTASFSSLPIPD